MRRLIIVLAAAGAALAIVAAVANGGVGVKRPAARALRTASVGPAERTRLLRDLRLEAKLLKLTHRAQPLVPNARHEPYFGPNSTTCPVAAVPGGTCSAVPCTVFVQSGLTIATPTNGAIVAQTRVRGAHAPTVNVPFAGQASCHGHRTGPVHAVPVDIH